VSDSIAFQCILVVFCIFSRPY